MESTPDPTLPTPDAPGPELSDELTGVRHVVRADFPAPDPIPAGPMPPMDMRVTVKDDAPLAAKNDLLAGLLPGMTPIPDGVDVRIELVFRAVTDPQNDMVRLVATFGDWITVDLGVRGAFDEDEDAEPFDEDTMAEWGQDPDDDGIDDPDDGTRLPEPERRSAWRAANGVAE